MTERRYADLCTSLQAHRLDMLDVAGRLSKRAHEQREARAGRTVDRWASETELDAVAVANGVRELSERADELLEDTAVLELADIAESPLASQLRDIAQRVHDMACQPGIAAELRALADGLDG